VKVNQSNIDFIPVKPAAARDGTEWWNMELQATRRTKRHTKAKPTT
jgi:hypothetical protein